MGGFLALVGAAIIIWLLLKRAGGNSSALVIPATIRSPESTAMPGEVTATDEERFHVKLHWNPSPTMDSTTAIGKLASLPEKIAVIGLEVISHPSKVGKLSNPVLMGQAERLRDMLSVAGVEVELVRVSDSGSSPPDENSLDQSISNPFSPIGEAVVESPSVTSEQSTAGGWIFESNAVSSTSQSQSANSSGWIFESTGEADSDLSTGVSPSPVGLRLPLGGGRVLTDSMAGNSSDGPDDLKSYIIDLEPGFGSNDSQPDKKVALPDSDVKQTVLIPAMPVDSGVKSLFSRWVAPGEVVVIGGVAISCGMIFVGKSVSYNSKNHHLIDPSLKVSTGQSDWSGITLSHWPSYSDINPAARLTYLRWLSEGRHDPGIGIGYVFMFFYGLEKRLFQDCAVDDCATIVEEVKRLLKIYGSNLSFNQYANILLDAAPLLIREITPQAPMVLR